MVVPVKLRPKILIESPTETVEGTKRFTTGGAFDSVAVKNIFANEVLKPVVVTVLLI